MLAFVKSAWPKFSRFIQQAADVISPQEYFCMDEYMDLAKSRKPTIILSTEEIINTHSILKEHLSDIVMFVFNC